MEQGNNDLTKYFVITTTDTNGKEVFLMSLWICPNSREVEEELLKTAFATLANESCRSIRKGKVYWAFEILEKQYQDKNNMPDTHKIERRMYTNFVYDFDCLHYLLGGRIFLLE